MAFFCPNEDGCVSVPSKLLRQAPKCIVVFLNIKQIV